MDLAIPITWKGALAIVKRAAPEAVMAGGCLRDLDNGRPVKDIDIFVECRTRRRAEALDGLRNRLVAMGIDCDEVDQEKVYPVGHGNDVVGFFEARFEGLSIPVQVIMIDVTPPSRLPCGDDLDDDVVARVLGRIDYGICRIAFDGSNVTAGPEYRADRELQVFRLRQDRREGELSASVHRYARLSRKYEGWTWEPYTKDWAWAI
jgi:hypothetical protein